MNYLYVGMGGFIGSVLRYTIGLIMNNDTITFPFATLTVNLLGSFFLSFLVFTVFRKVNISTNVQVALTAGLLGSFTTFSAVSVATISLLENGELLFACLYLLITISGGFGMAFLGYLFKKKVVGACFYHTY